jgi:hypothetical protein
MKFRLRGCGMVIFWSLFAALTQWLVFVSYVQGQKVVCPQADNTEQNLQVLDFNVLPNYCQDPGSVNKTICITPTHLPGDHIFKQDVITSLKYCVTTRKAFDNYSAYMIDEERVIGLKVRSNYHCYPTCCI